MSSSWVAVEPRGMGMEVPLHLRKNPNHPTPKPPKKRPLQWASLFVGLFNK